MKTVHVAESWNRYCARLGLPTPDLDTAVTRPDVTIAHLMALAVLEAGGPLPLEAIAERLQHLALPPRLAAGASRCRSRKSTAAWSP